MLDVFSDDVSRSKALVMSTFSVEQDLLRELMEVNPEIQIHLIAAKDECDKLKDIQGARLHLTPLETRTAILNRVHAKVYLFLREGGAKCYVGTFNLTRSGMENNVEFFAEFEGRYIQSALTLEDFENHQELPFWRRFCQDNVVNGVAQFLNSIINGRFEGPFLSDRIADYHRETPIFIHTLGKKTIPQQIQSHIRKKASDCKYAKLRFVSPYHTTGSIQKFADLVCQNIGCRAKIELLTNFVPDYRNRYDEKSFLEPSSIDELKELLSAKEVELEVRFWDRHGYEEEEIPGRFLHGKLLLVECGRKSGAKDHCVFLLSSNLTAAGLGLDRPPNLEAGLFDDDPQRCMNLWNLIDGIWKLARQASNADTWRQIDAALKRVSEEDVFFTREVEQMRRLRRETQLKGRGGKTVVAATGQKPTFHYGFDVVVPSDDSLKEFLKGKVMAKLDRTGFDFSRPRLSFSLRDLRGTKHSENLPLKMMKEQDRWIANLKNLKDRIQRGFTIDSMALLVDTKRVGDPVFFKAQDLEKGRRLNLLEIEDERIVLFDFVTRWFSPETDSVAAFANTDSGIRKLSTERISEDLVVGFPSSKVRDDSREVMIVQDSAKMHPRFLLHKILELKPVEDPILSVEATIDSVNLPAGDDVEALRLDTVLEDEFIELDSSDFSISDGLTQLRPFCVLEKTTRSKKHMSMYLPQTKGKRLLTLGLRPPISKWFPGLTKEITVSSRREFPHDVYKEWRSKILEQVGIRFDPRPGFATGDSEISVLTEKPGGNLLARISPRWGEYDPDCETATLSLDTERTLIGKYEPGITLFTELLFKDGKRRFTLESLNYPIRHPLCQSSRWILPFKDHPRSFPWLSRLFVFAVEFSLEPQDDEVFNWVKSFAFRVNGEVLKPVEIHTPAVNQDKLVLYFKKGLLAEGENQLNLDCVVESHDYFADQQSNVVVIVKLTTNAFFVSIGEDTRTIYDGNPGQVMGPIRDNVKELHYYLGLERHRSAHIAVDDRLQILHTQADRRDEMRRQLPSVGLRLTECDNDWYIDCAHSVLPVWFRPLRKK